MRALTVVGLAESGTALLCEDSASGEQFVLSGEELRVAAGAHREHRQQQHEQQVQQRDEQRRMHHDRRDRETTMEPELRPRDIQARVRLGESLEAVAAAAGCDVSRIEKYAYPVLMERSSVALRAQSAYPMVNGAVAKSTVAELAVRTLAARGQNDSVAWDAYRSEGGGWVLKVTWSVGHSENSARFSYSPAGSGGSVSPLDDAAASLIDATPRPLRTVPEAEVAPDSAAETAPVNPLVLQADPQPALIPEPEHTAPTRQADKPAEGNRVAAAMARNAGSRGTRPAMPSWEDVLLGVRSGGH